MTEHGGFFVARSSRVVMPPLRMTRYGVILSEAAKPRSRRIFPHPTEKILRLALSGSLRMTEHGGFFVVMLAQNDSSMTEMTQ